MKLPTFIEEGEHETDMDVEVLTIANTATVTVVGIVVTPRGEPVTMKLYEPGAAEAATLTDKILDALVEVGVTGLTVRDPQVIPEAREEPAQDSVTGSAVSAVRVAVIVTLPELPAVIVTGPLLDNE